MRLDALSVVIRPRHAYEAADLGIQLAAQKAPALFRLWLLLSLPVALLALALEHITGNRFALIVLWWCKPLLDYGVLCFLSQAVFGDTPNWRRVLAALPGFFGKGLSSALLWRRFSFSRAFVLPVWLLEGLHGHELRDRVQVLRRQGTGPARSLHLIFALFEVSVCMVLASQILFFVPTVSSMADLQAFVSAGAGTLPRDVTVLLYSLAVGIVEPLYISAGFMLYLNRRTELEAWDVEIALRRLIGRLPPRREAA